MPFQPINFAGIPAQRNDTVSNWLGNIMQGYQQAQAPEVMRQAQALKIAEILKNQQLAQKAAEEARYVSPLAESLIGQRGMQGKEMEALAALHNIQAQSEPEKLAALINQQKAAAAQHYAMARKANIEANNPFLLAGGLSGVGREALGVELLGKQYGTQSPVYQNAKRAYESNLRSADVLNQYRLGLAGTQDKRAATSLGKAELEALDIAQGFLPGSGRTQRLSPEQQTQLSQEYGLQKQKMVSDQDSRKKALFASNIDKTLDTISVPDLVQYAGIKGALKKATEQSKAPLGKESADYRAYEKSLNSAKILAKQVRQFYGDSITPGIQEGIKELTSPSSWKNNPEIAAQNFNNLKNILQKETATYRGALKSTKEFNQPTKTRLKYNSLTGGFE